MKRISNKGQAEVMDGLILLLIVATCSVVLLGASSNYGGRALEIYEENYAKKLAQNTLLSLYHITYLDDQNSPLYKKSIMVALSNELSSGGSNIKESEAGRLIGGVLDKYAKELGWNFMFCLLDGGTEIRDNSVISTAPNVVDRESYMENAGNPYCATAALTYPKGDCSAGGGGEAGNMCYAIIEVCVWQS